MKAFYLSWNYDQNIVLLFHRILTNTPFYTAAITTCNHISWIDEKICLSVFESDSLQWHCIVYWWGNDTLKIINECAEWILMSTFIWLVSNCHTQHSPVAGLSHSHSGLFHGDVHVLVIPHSEWACQGLEGIHQWLSGKIPDVISLEHHVLMFPHDSHLTVNILAHHNLTLKTKCPTFNHPDISPFWTLHHRPLYLKVWKFMLKDAFCMLCCLYHLHFCHKREQENKNHCGDSHINCCYLHALVSVFIGW